MHGHKVVYDPQSPSNPTLFSNTGSTADSLALVVNLREAKRMAQTDDISEIRNFFFKKEGVDSLILKMGPKGAMVVDSPSNDGVIVPVHKTNSVWPIGSGDVFASMFAHFWFNGKNIIEAAHNASLLTSQYCETKSFGFDLTVRSKPLLIEKFPIGKIYLAGPFFTYSQRWLIDQARNSLVGMGLRVFSPWHDIGHGIASEVVLKDLRGLEESQLLFAVIDGLDSGTLFEVGYAVKKGIPVIAYVENESEESVKMLAGTGCFLEKDFTTAIYKSFWLICENE